MSTVIATSTVSTATAYSNQWKIDRCQNGVLWAAFNVIDANDTSIFRMDYSTDNGATWTFGSYVLNASGSSSNNYTPNGSIFIDLDDYCHVVFKDRHDGYIYYRRGTPNAARTAWTWSSAVTVRGGTLFDYSDIVAHREGAGWKVHIVTSQNQSSFDSVNYSVIGISSSGTISTASTSVISSSTYGNSNHKWPSIDFNHTGDGKTVAGSTPHLYVVWSAGAVGSGKGIRFKKASYSGGSWTWGTEWEIDSTRYVGSSARWINCMFDGTRVIMGGWVDDGSNRDLILYERDAADTTTTQRELIADTTSTDAFQRGSITYDGDGNVYLFGYDFSNPTVIEFRKWDRATTTLGTATTIHTASGVLGSHWIAAKRGYSNGKIEFIYTDGTSSPYSVTYSSISLNAPSNLPTNLQRVGVETDTTPEFSCEVSDPNTDDQIKARFEIQTSGGAAVAIIDSDFRTGNGVVTKEYSSALSTGEYRVRAKSIDGSGEESAYTDWLDFRVTQAVVPKDAALQWNVVGNQEKDFSLSWDVAEGNLKNVSLLWDVYAQTNVDVELPWRVATPWREVPEENPSIWTEVY